MMKRIVTRLALQIGYTIVPNWRSDSYPGLRHTRRLFELLGVDLVVDVGSCLILWLCRQKRPSVPIYDGAPSYTTVIEHLVAQGFLISGMFPNNEGRFPQLAELTAL